MTEQEYAKELLEPMDKYILSEIEKINAIEFIRESNSIEDINREPKKSEIDEYLRFMDLARVSVADLEMFVSVYQSNAKIRSLPNMNVRVGNYVPPEGGPDILIKLDDILYRANNMKEHGASWKECFEIHCEYEKLHPFMDGNGRSGRMLWQWMMGHTKHYGFLRTFYYQTLQNAGPSARYQRMQAERQQFSQGFTPVGETRVNRPRQGGLVQTVAAGDFHAYDDDVGAFVSGGTVTFNPPREPNWGLQPGEWQEVEQPARWHGGAGIRVTSGRNVSDTDFI